VNLCRNLCINSDTLILPDQSGRCFTPEIEVLVVYLRVRIVSITLTSKVLDVLAVLDVVGGDSDLPSVGIKPANIEVDNAHTSTTAIANFFMSVSLVSISD
jgi:hypothetical protein